MRNGPSPWGWAGAVIPIPNTPEGSDPARHHNPLSAPPFRLATAYLEPPLLSGEFGDFRFQRGPKKPIPDLPEGAEAKERQGSSDAYQG